MTAISADARKALRTTLTNHPGWDDYRKRNALSLATMTRDDYHRACEALRISIPEGSTRARRLREVDEGAPLPGARVGDAEGNRRFMRAHAAEQAREDFADADTVVVPTDAQIKKIDGFIAFGFDEPLPSYRDLLKRVGIIP